MNAKPGCKQPVMRDTINPFTGNVQQLVFNIGLPKGLIQVLKERGIDTRKMKLDAMRKELASHTDFKEETTRIEHYQGHICMLLPKFHCEINPIERCWAKAKRYTVHTLIILLKNYVKIFQMASTLYHLRVYKNTSAKLECICL